MSPVLVINAVGLTPRLLPHAPRLAALAARSWSLSLHEPTPAVTCTSQATILTGAPPNRHGIVANGWLFRDTREIRFWQQSNALIQGEPLYATARRRAAARDRLFKCAKLFWWFNQGADVDISVTPKPWYGIDGDKVFGIASNPTALAARLERSLGPFPFHTFWGPLAGLPCTQWIARCAADVLLTDQPDLTLVYLPHLDYDPQRHGPSGTDMTRCVGELDEACAPLLDAAVRTGAQVWVVSEYGHTDVTAPPIYLNRILRQADLLSVRAGPFGEQLDPYASRAFAVCDHQLAHVYVRNPIDVARVADLLRPHCSAVLNGDDRATISLDHARSGEIVCLSPRTTWFAYPFWLDDAAAPDYARAVAIHHKPGFDPAEMFFDPELKFPKLRVARKILQKKLGFRMTLDVVPLDASIVKGTHGLPAENPQDGAILIGHGPKPSTPALPMTSVRDLLLNALELGEDK